jgi:hypothetical protein
MRIPKTRRTGCGLLIALMLGAAACSSASAGPSRVATLGSTAPPASSGTSDTTVPKDARQAGLDFAKCMRDHGIDMKDPTVGANGGGMQIDLNSNRPQAQMDKAQQACQHLLDAAAGSMKRVDPKQAAQVRKQMLAYAQCMRDQGLDFPDPTFTDKGGLTRGSVKSKVEPGKKASGVPNGDDPKFKAADKICQKKAGMPKGGLTTHVQNGEKNG